MKSRTLWFIVITLLIATGLRVWQIDVQSIWFDEGFSWHAATQPDLLTTLNGDPTNPPLYYLLLHIWIRFIGNSAFNLRALSLMQGIILLAVMTTSARRWFGDKVALTAAALGAFLPLLWWASQEARMYNTLAIAVLLMTTGLSEILEHSQQTTRRGWAMLLCGELAALYTHNTGIVVFGAVNIVFGLTWLVVWWHKHGSWRLLRNWLIGQGLIVILWLPELTARFQAVDTANQASASPPQLSLTLLWQSWQALWANSWQMVLSEPTNLSIIAGLLLPLAVIALFALKQRAGRLLLAMFVTLYLLLIAALIVLGVNFHGRYLVMITPLFVITLAAGVEQLATNKIVKNTLAIGVIAVGGLVWLLLPGQPNPDYQHDQAQAMVAHYTDTLSERDLVLTWSYAERYDLSYYWKQMGTTAQLVTLPDGATPAAVLDIINSYIIDDETPFRAEINTWYTQASDRRGSLPCIIGHNRPTPGPTYTVYGMASTPYELQGPLTFQPPTNTPANFANTVQLESVGFPTETIPAHHGICLPLTFTITRQTPENLTAAVNVLNALGWEIATADTPGLNAIQIPTSRLTVGDNFQAFPLFYLPQGTPPGTPPVNLRLYSPNNPDGLDVLADSSGTPTGKDAPLGELPITTGEWPAYPADCAVEISPGVVLTDCPTPSTIPASAGNTLALTLHWQIENAPQPITLTLSGSNWEVMDTQIPTTTGPFLDWRAFLIPAEATGPAVLTAQVANEQPVKLADLTIEKPEHIMVAPPFAQAAAINFPGIGALAGFTIETSPITTAAPLAVTLVWQSSATTPIPYTVTVQLLSAEGVVLAQHDSQPANNERPTTGWIAAEYIVDTHLLTFKEELKDYTGPARLIIALYDATTGERTALDTGATHALLSDSLTITPE